MTRSRPARLTLSALAWIALGAAAFVVLQTRQQVDHRRELLRTFESTARDAADALDDAQAGQEAYVALGQDAGEWMPKVATYLQTAAASIDALRTQAASAVAGPSLLDAATAMTEIGNLDRQVSKILKGCPADSLAALQCDDARRAADIIFSESADAVSSAVSSIDTAVGAEQQEAAAFEADTQRAGLYAAGGAAAFVAVVLVLLGFAAPRASEASSTSARIGAAPDEATPGRPELGQLDIRVAPTAAQIPTAASQALTAIAPICTGFGRARDAVEVKSLLEQAATVLNARGLIVWLGSTDGADLRPVLAYGYSDTTLARIPAVERSADNAAAAAYRTGEVQIVKSTPGAAQGAIVAPMLAGEACIGALTAEIRDSGEESDTTRAVAVILAAQLAGVLATAAENAAAAAKSQARTGTD